MSPGNKQGLIALALALVTALGVTWAIILPPLIGLALWSVLH